MKRNVLKSVLWLVGVGVLVVIFAKSVQPVNESIVGLTYKAQERDCKTKEKTTCNEPDPAGVVFEFEFPAGLRADDRSARYEYGVRLNMLVTPTSITPISKVADRQEVMSENYALGAHGNIKLFARDPGEKYESFLMDGVESASVYEPDNYHKSEGGAYVLYDSEECKDLLPSDLVPSESALHLSCYSKRILYEPKGYEWAYSICPRRFVGADGGVSVPVCVVVSRIAPGVFMRYHVSGEYVGDQSWIGYDKRIRDYIFNFRAK
ncbi:hypothetical protein [Pseudomonas indica]|uniref:hypothetical protein n=1 Tax=Pseudomonas indica TaxID=137658 RepID=UPI0023F8F012|nr:hypothetical protein [Pseudomonas indica]MBU3055524.1 hypothetical protein [Pseudomonas indica]